MPAMPSPAKADFLLVRRSYGLFYGWAALRRKINATPPRTNIIAEAGSGIA